ADEVKIDQSFIRELATDHGDAAIVRSIIALSHDLGLDVTAERADTAEAVQLLEQFGCDQIQGYHLCRPLDAGALAAWIRRFESRGLSHPADRHPSDSLEVS